LRLLCLGSGIHPFNVGMYESLVLCLADFQSKDPTKQEWRNTFWSAELGAVLVIFRRLVEPLFRKRRQRGIKNDIVAEKIYNATSLTRGSPAKTIFW